MLDFLKDGGVSCEEAGQESCVEGGGAQVGGREGEGERGTETDRDLQGPKYLEPGTGGPGRTARTGMWGLPRSRLGGRGWLLKAGGGAELGDGVGTVFWTRRHQ